jgi:Fe-S cluster assembly protein SufD
MMTTGKLPADRALAALFAERRASGAIDARTHAWEAFSSAGLPSRRSERWRYTDLRQAAGEIAPASCDSGTLQLVRERGLRVVVWGGELGAERGELAAAPEGVSVQSLREALTQNDSGVIAALAPVTGDPAVDLNAALMQDGAVIRIASGAQIEKPITLVTMLQGAISAFTRNLVIVGEGAKATIVEAALPLLAGAQENHALVIKVGRGAQIEHVADFSPSEAGSVRVYSLVVELDEMSSLNSTALISGGGLVRRQVFARLSGARAAARFSGATLLKARDHADTTLLIEHLAPQGESREKFRTIVDGEATGVFQGKASVARAAQKTDGVMQSKALLLSDGATMNNKPELEIFADDVACGHGATCGRLETDQVFYLMARGLPRQEAEALLIEGFANEALTDVDCGALREELSGKIAAWLGERELASMRSPQ